MPDDVVMELRLGDTELAFTRDELDDAAYVGDGTYRLKSGALLRFLSTPTVALIVRRTLDITARTIAPGRRG